MSPIVSSVAGSIEKRLRALENQVLDILRRLTNVENKARQSAQQLATSGPTNPQNGSNAVGSYWATTSGVVEAGTSSGPGVGSGSVVVVNSSFQYATVGSSLTLINGWNAATDSNSWVRVRPTDLTDSSGNPVFDIAGEGCSTSSGGGS